MFDVVIIGAGPAGLACGIYAARGGLKVAIIESQSVGGQAQQAADIQNYPGIPSTSGFDLCYAMMNQCVSFGVEFKFDGIISTSLVAGTKAIRLASGDTIEARNVVIATGAAARKLDLANESKFTGKGISYCATCDGAFFKGKTVAVIGGGNTAAEDALYLEKIAKRCIWCIGATLFARTIFLQNALKQALWKWCGTALLKILTAMTNSHK